MPTHVYRVTKYNPADRDGHGHYTGPEDTVSDHGEVEAARTRELGLFPERLDASPYAFETEEEDQAVERPGDDDFWADLHRTVTDGHAGILEETYLEGASRWHHLSTDTLFSLRAALAPRARLAVWPPLSTDMTPS
ncbi:hypothetical protein [Streptomyces sp. S.PB5]|uniref:hypothetical protein n=1 Tax=Streptomyces sp. S.PB5 TaxID=3020844 RepID=UPI0025AF12D8|nr:hypothetical protein [Streptomyces sp. S.PB5]MDN3024792.1 hypothetical protein [Streptomyces sp. S.PB5]